MVALVLATEIVIHIDNHLYIAMHTPSHRRIAIGYKKRVSECSYGLSDMKVAKIQCVGALSILYTLHSVTWWSYRQRTCLAVSPTRT